MGCDIKEPGSQSQIRWVGRHWNDVVELRACPEVITGRQPSRRATRDRRLPGRLKCHAGAFDSSAFQRGGTSALSEPSPTKPLLDELRLRREISTGLGDQGSQVRVLSPRRTRNLIWHRSVARCVGSLSADGV
jgi:hypothetical protein